MSTSRHSVWRARAGLPGAAAALALALTVTACDEGLREPTGPDAVITAAGTPGSGDKNPMFDFNDAFYSTNGVDPNGVIIRVGTSARDSSVWTFGSIDDPSRNDIRILETNACYGASGDLCYFTINGVLVPSSFTDDAAGQEARRIADSFLGFIFPYVQADGSFVLSVAPNERRQENIFNTNDGYFSNDPLQLWRLTWVVFTDKAFKRLLKKGAFGGGTESTAGLAVERARSGGSAGGVTEEARLVRSTGGMRPRTAAAGPPGLLAPGAVRERQPAA